MVHTWDDCDFEKGEIIVRGDPKTGTIKSQVRRVPMIPDMRELLQQIKIKQKDNEGNQKVMKVVDVRKSLSKVCKQLEIPIISHRDLRHLFATRCIESGVDVPTVSRWLGHKDGGVLAMRVYGHLRDRHSTAMAQMVSFK